MIYKIEVENFRNFNEKFVFDLSEIKNFEFNIEAVDNGTIKKSIIYGPNGSGKSNLGLAIFDIVSNLTDKFISPELYINYLNAESNNEIAKFKYYFKFNDVNIEYYYGKKEIEEIVFEELYIDKKLLVKLDKTESMNAVINISGAENLSTDMSKSKISILKYIKNNSILNENRENAALINFFDYVDKMLFFRSLNSNNYIGFETGRNRVLKDIVERENVKEFEIFLNRAGIECELVSLEYNNEKSIGFKFGEKIIEFHQVASTGTQSLAVFYYWLQRLGETSLVFIDEFDAFYHHNLSKIIVEELRKIDNQTILTTHNTSIMTNDLLRPDCYFILNNKEIKPIYKYTEKDLRKAHNIEKMYRAGVFDE